MAPVAQTPTFVSVYEKVIINAKIVKNAQRIPPTKLL